jgi:hypothetical protein
VDSTIAAVGASGDDTSRGSVYLYGQDAGGLDNWGEITKVVANDGQANDVFGISAALSGTTLVVGANHTHSNRGSAYVYYKDQDGEDSWGQVIELAPSDGQPDDEFGLSVAISGDLILVGAWKHELTPGVAAGAAYIFQKDSGDPNNWVEVIKLTASDGADGDLFGYSVALQGDTAVVGAWGHEPTLGVATGAAYVFQKDEGGLDNWGEVKKLTAWDGVAGDGFGFAVGISGDLAAVGAFFDDLGTADQGSVYVFARDRDGLDNWGLHLQMVANDAAPSDQFGISVAIANNLLLSGAHSDDIGLNANQGSAYVMDATGVFFHLPLVMNS